MKVRKGSCILVALPASAQRPRGRYTPPAPRVGYSSSRSTYGRSYGYVPNTYFGLRFGLSASHVSSDAPDLSSNSSKSGLDVGAVVGIQMAPEMPLFFETGLLSVEKGGKGKFDGNKFSYGLIHHYFGFHHDLRRQSGSDHQLLLELL